MLLYWSFSYKTHEITITPTKQKKQTKNPTDTTQNNPSHPPKNNNKQTKNENTKETK